MFPSSNGLHSLHQVPLLHSFSFHLFGIIINIRRIRVCAHMVIYSQWVGRKGEQHINNQDGLYYFFFSCLYAAKCEPELSHSCEAWLHEGIVGVYFQYACCCVGHIPASVFSADWFTQFSVCRTLLVISCVSDLCSHWCCDQQCYEYVHCGWPERSMHGLQRTGMYTEGCTDSKGRLRE